METLIQEAVKHIYSIEVFAITNKLSNTTFGGFVGRKVGDALDVETRLRQHENAVTLRFTNKLDIPIPGKRDYEIHEILKKDSRVKWDGETNEGLFTGREVFYMKDHNDDVTYIDQVILNWALGKIRPVDDYAKRQEWFSKSENHWYLNRVQHRLINRIVNAFERKEITRGKMKHLLEAVPRSGKSVMSLYIAKKLGAKRILIITPFPDADRSFKQIVEFHPDFLDSIFKDVRKDFKGTEICFTNKNSGLEVIMTSWQNLDEDKEKFNKLFDSGIDFVIIDETHRQSDSKRSESIVDRFYSQNIKLPILHLSGTPYNDKISGRFTPSETTTYDIIDKLRDVANARYKLENSDFKPEEKDELEYIASFPDIKFILAEKMEDAFRQAKIEYPSVDENSPLDVFFSDPSNEFKTIRRFFYEGLAPKRNPGQVRINTNTLISGEYMNEFFQIMMFFENNAVCDMNKLELQELCSNPNSGWYGYEIKSISGREEQDNYDNLENDINEWQQKYNKLIILSVGKATTGLTMKKLSSIWIMRRMRSAELFVQILFRLGTPCKGKEKVNVVIFDSEAVITAQAMIAKNRTFKNNKNKSSQSSESFQENLRELSTHMPVLLYDGIEYTKFNSEDILSFCREIVQRKSKRLSKTDLNEEIDLSDLKELASLSGIDPKKFDKQIGQGGQKIGKKFTTGNKKNKSENKNSSDDELSKTDTQKIVDGINFLLEHMDWILQPFGGAINNASDISKLSDEDFKKIKSFVNGKKVFSLNKDIWIAIYNCIDTDVIEKAIFETNLLFYSK